MTQKNNQNLNSFKRVVRFGDTDAAGVIHFYHLLRWSHESWEESLENYGLGSRDIFPSSPFSNSPLVSLPIVHCSSDFRLPIAIGDHLAISVLPEKIDLSSFQVKTDFHRGGNLVGESLIRHVAINSQTRKRCKLPEPITLWIEASSLSLRPRPV